MADPSNGTTAKNAALSSIPGGACVRLVGIDAGQGLAGRLAALGLLPGVQLLVITNPGTGPAIVEVKGTRLALGRGMAHKMLVEAL
ncbi:ferrous iron transport protein A [bacterium]|nr:ferrous iron transport protein A [bacterium]